MTLWLASALLVFLAAGLIALALLARRKGKKAWMIAAIVISAVFILAALAYILLAFTFLGAASKQPPDESSGVSAPDNPIPEMSSEPPVTAAPLPDDYDLPTDEVPTLHPDVLELRSAQYKTIPAFGTQNEVTRFVLYNFLEERFEIEFYLEKGFAVDEGTGHVILNRACETAMAYCI